MHTPFTFEPTGSDKATAFLAARAEYLPKLDPAGRRLFLRSSLTSARTLPLSSDVSAFDKASVLITLQRWLDEVCEVAA